MRLTSRKLRNWLKWTSALGMTLVLLSFVLAGSNVSADQSKEWLGKRVLLVTAHPDDEVMFFAPSILALVSMGVQVYSLCLSIGNADNLGIIRKQELLDSYASLGVPSPFVESVDDPQLQDGMTTDWSIEAITKYITKQAQDHGPFEAIITFDEKGISGHPNHSACYRAIKYLSQSSILPPYTKLYILHTVSVSIKYLSLPLAITRHFLPSDSARQLRFFSSFQGYLYSIRAMTAHASQLVWFRYLYIMTSVYMYDNELVKL